MYATRYNATVTISIVGGVDTAITTHANPDVLGASWLSVRTGPGLTYCDHARTVAGVAAAWNNAFAKARRLLPVEADLPDTSAVAVAQINAGIDDTWDVTGAAARAAHDGIGFLSVRIGALTVRCHDQRAVEALHEIWREAALVGHVMWRPRGVHRM